MYLFVDSTRETGDKNIELIVSLTSLSRWYDTGTGDGGSSFGAMATTTEKGGRGASISTDKTATEVSPARGLGGRQRTSNFEMIPQTPGPNCGLHDANSGDSK